MHDSTDPETAAMLASLLTCEGWPLVRRLFADAEYAQILDIRQNPLGPTAEAAAVKLAHIEELREMVRSITPDHIGDPFDVAESASEARHGPGPEPESESEPDPDEYEL